LLASARERGAVAVNGVAMLVHQAALAFELWTGVAAPLPAMSRVVADAVSAASASGPTGAGAARVPTERGQVEG
jgi:shikimate dehydrogenase